MTALVATATTFSACRLWAACLNRPSVVRARAIASGLIRRLGNVSRPRPVGSFIRHSVVTPPSGSIWATIMWIELLPTSIAAKRSDSPVRWLGYCTAGARAAAGSVVSGRFGHAV